MEKEKSTVKDYAEYIEYTNLKSPNSKQIKKFIETANKEKYLGVCLNSEDLTIANKYREPNLKLITVAGFPPIRTFSMFSEGRNKQLLLALGLYNQREIDKIKSTIDMGIADELDLVFPIYWYARGQFLRIHKFLKGIKDRFKKPVKVIVELGTVFSKTIPLYEITDLLKQSGVDYFKTNTGLVKQDFSKLISSIVAVQTLMYDTGVQLPIKASGGIRTEEQVKTLIQIGVKRIGTSSIKTASKHSINGGSINENSK